jgi:uncharacterized membrane protein
MKTSVGEQPASYSIDTEGLPPGKEAGSVKLITLINLVLKSRTAELDLHSSARLHEVMFNQAQGQFYFYIIIIIIIIISIIDYWWESQRERDH